MSDPAQAEKGIQCHGCGCRDLRVYRTSRYPNFILRYRRCRHCGRKQTTRERASGVPNSPLAEGSA